MRADPRLPDLFRLGGRQLVRGTGPDHLADLGHGKAIRPGQEERDGQRGAMSGEIQSTGPVRVQGRGVVQCVADDQGEHRVPDVEDLVLVVLVPVVCGFAGDGVSLVLVQLDECRVESQPPQVGQARNVNAELGGGFGGIPAGQLLVLGDRTARSQPPGQLAQLGHQRSAAGFRGQFPGHGQPQRRHPVGQPEGLLQADEVVVRVFLVITEPGQTRVIAADPAVHGRLVVQVDAVGGHRVDERAGHAPVRRVHHDVGEPRRDLVQLPFQRAGRALRYLAAFG